jgi:hypothetical protein
MANAKTELFVRKQSGGMFTVNNESLNTGNIFWVCSVTGTNSVGNGGNPDSPFATLAYAISQCTDSNDDRIYVMRHHAEAVIAAGTITLNKIGVSIIGLGSGTSRPTFSWTTISSATMLLTAASTRISNCIFDIGNGITGLTSGIVISAAGCTIDNCTFYPTKAGTWIAPLQSILTTAGANYLTVRNCVWSPPALTTTTISAATSVITLVGGSGIQILDNFISSYCTTTTGPLSCITTLTDNILVARNTIWNQTAVSAKAISLLTGSTGAIVNNRLGVLTGTAPAAADGCMFAGNVYTATLSVTAGTASTF